MSAGYSSESQCGYISADTHCHYSCKQWHFFRRERKMHLFSDTCSRIKQLRLRKIFFFHGVLVLFLVNAINNDFHYWWLSIFSTLSILESYVSREANFPNVSTSAQLQALHQRILTVWSMTKLSTAFLWLTTKSQRRTIKILYILKWKFWLLLLNWYWFL